MRDLDLTTLRLLVAVCEQQNMARVAEQSHIAASAISKRIAQLESNLGVRLLVRTRRGVQPTPAGLALIDHARTMLFAAERIETDVTAFAGGIKGKVRILATPSAMAESLLEDISSFMREPVNSEIKVDIEECLTNDLLRNMREGRTAIGVCWNHADLGELQQSPYRQDRLALAVHRDHPLARRKSLRYEDTLDYEHVGMRPDSAVVVMLQRAAAQIGRPVRYRVIVSNFDAAFRVVAANLAVGVIPFEISTLYASASQVKMIPLEDAWAQREFCICFREWESLSVPARRLVKHLESPPPSVAAPEARQPH
ncbi:LysR family transcriptional regulator [Herbaspirillum sp. CAH-3]|uniref:LysR family transcriptional regulator n=1 Tax=Herbaspirillum sp. CAH-3 TaxID=2605746 RepID=UPI0012AC9282|nr:LysR family transcriptional regulator [Herbaspirillum sp. CAH-3]MRT28327.1 LysR family transcriptional regulator [Herbaspirillum sp. CAH-3]